MIRYLFQLGTFWLIIYTVHHLLLHLSQRLYPRFLRQSGCQISLFYLGFYTSSFNRSFHSIARRLTWLWKYWFNLGIALALITGVIASLTLIFLPIQSFAQLYRQSISINRTIHRDELTLQPLIPGVNLPWEQLGHFLAALIVSTVIHEMGHGIAAAMERVRINGCGGFIYLIYPGAYVDLNQEQVEMLSALQQLRIYCAGVFHNLVLVLLAFLFLLIHPFLLRSFYLEAANVYRVTENSPIYHLLPVQSRLLSIDDCSVKTSADWSNCLRSIQRRHPLQSPGYCLTSAQVQLFSSHLEFNQNTSYDCCAHQSAKNYCFLYRSSSTERNGACVEVRQVMNYPSCLTDEDCRSIDQAMCLQPFSSDNHTRLIRIGHSEGPPILFIGSIEEIARTVTIQSHLSTSIYLPNWFVTSFPLFIQYIAAISLALAFFNAVPCHGFDGQYILTTVFENPPRSILILGSALVFLNIALTLLTYFVSV